MAHELGLWVEIVTLVVPGFNDSTEELMDAARFIRSVSPDIPWHVTAFHPDYKMTDPPPTSAKTLLRAAEIGQEAGLHYVYAGNIPGRVGEYESTLCPNCQTPLIERTGYVIHALPPHRPGRLPEVRHSRSRGVDRPAGDGEPGRDGHAAPDPPLRLSGGRLPAPHRGRPRRSGIYTPHRRA